ncbi:MAG: UPF0175 family protein [Bacteroidia bacterium]|jgi:hypothetical protein|nr:UPF0175 family protein [Bacteroidia bacterium]
MKKLVLEIPDEANDFDVKMAVGAMLYDKTVLTAGQAAEFVGIDKRTFLESLGKFGVSIFGESSADLSNIKIE